MKYEGLDPYLESWAKAHGLTIFTKHRDDAVRSVLVVDDAGNVFGIGVWPDGDTIWVGVGDYQTKDHSCQTATTLAQLSATLEEAYAQVEQWIAASGNTRTPVL